MSDASGTAEVTWKNLDLRKFAFVGGSVFFAEYLVVYPLDLVITRVTVDTSQDTMKFWRGSYNTLKSVYKSEGYRGLYRGFTPTVVLGTPSYGCYILTYQYSKEKLNKGLDNVPWFGGATKGNHAFVPFIAGGIADVASHIIATPKDVIVSRLQAGDTRYTGGMHAARRIFEEEGFRGLYKGLTGSLMVSPLSSAVWWMAYEGLKKQMDKYDHHYDNVYNYMVEDGWMLPVTSSVSSSKSHENFGKQFLAGMFAQMFNTALMNPFNVILTRWQTQAQAHRGLEFWGVVKETMQKEGLRAFSRGLMPKILMLSPFSAVSAVVYEFVIRKSAII